MYLCFVFILFMKQDPEELEIRAAFDTYSDTLLLDAVGGTQEFAQSSLSQHSLTALSVLSDDKDSGGNNQRPVSALGSSPNGKMDAFSQKKANAPKSVIAVGANLRAALVQLLNTNVSTKLIEQALQADGMGKAQHLNLSDFKIVFFRFVF